MSLKNKLYNIQCELDKIPSRSSTFETCVKKRLSRSVDIHSQYVKRICGYLNSRNSIKVLRQVKEFNKKKSKRLNNDKTN